MQSNVAALVPARAGSKGLPGKNLRPLGPKPLVAHSIELGLAISSVSGVYCSTDSPTIASVAIEYGARPMPLREPDLATDEAPMAAVITSFCKNFTRFSGDLTEPEYLLLLDPTSPFRSQDAINDALGLLKQHPAADGVVAVSVPDFNPIWVGVEFNHDGHLRRISSRGEQITRRQDAPPVWRMNGQFYIWRWRSAQNLPNGWFDSGHYLGFEVPERSAISIDSAEDFEFAEWSYEKFGGIRWD